MDIFSHALYGGAAFGRKNIKNYILAFLIGMGPDLFSFGILWAGVHLGFTSSPYWSKDHSGMNQISSYIHILYKITHSLVIFLAAFLAIWFIRRKPFWILGAWGLHILVDIPTHSFDFFPTPFLWPFSDFMINGIEWGRLIIFIPNVILLFSLYFGYFAWIIIKKKRNKKVI